MIIGASAAVFGVMLAFVLEWPDAPVLIFPLPFPVKAKWIVVFLAGLSLVAGLSGVRDGVAHLAHLGGFAAALLYLRGPALLRRGARTSAEGSTAVLVHPFSTETARGAPAVRTAAARGRREGAGGSGPGARQDLGRRALQPHAGRAPLPRRDEQEVQAGPLR